MRRRCLLCNDVYNKNEIGFSFQSHIDEQSDREDDMRDCESSDEGVNVNVNGKHTGGVDFSNHSPINRSTDIMKWVVEFFEKP